MAKTVNELILDFFINRPKTEFRHAPIEEWVAEQYIIENEGSSRPQDVRRAVRKLAETGRLIKVGRGIFKYDPDSDREVNLSEFSDSVKQDIFQRDNYRCVVCNLGTEDGVEIAVDHKIPRSKGGTNTLENGQTLCITHNNMKKNYTQTEAGKRYFIHIYETALQNQDEDMLAFCRSVFNAYDEHEINGHIERPDSG